MLIRILFVSLIAWALQGQVIAQASKTPKGSRKHHDNAPTPEVMAAKQAENLQKQLGLTEEQKSDVEKASLRRINRMRSIKEKFKNTAPDNPERIKEIRMVRQEFVEALHKILTPVQQETWKKLREEKKARKNNGKAKGKTGSVPEKDSDPNADVDEI